MKAFFHIVTAFLVTACSSKALPNNQTNEWNTYTATVVNLTERATVFSGIIPTWVRVETMAKENDYSYFYILNLSREDDLPKVGETCTFEGSERKLDGILSNSDPVPAEKVFAVNKFECDA